MYALVGKVTMSGLNHPTSFSWKSGFLASWSKGLYHHNGPLKDKAKRNSKIDCSGIKNLQNQPQWNFPTHEAVLPSASLGMATNLAPLLSLNATPASVFTKTTGKRQSQHDLLPPTLKSPGMVPHSNPKHDDGHIHQALLICSLLPENQKTQVLLTDIQYEDNMRSSQSSQIAVLSPIIGQLSLLNTSHECTSKPTDDMNRAGLPKTLEQSPSLPAPPKPPDAQDGPEAVMQAIDKWFVYQDSLALIQATIHSHKPADNAKSKPTAPMAQMDQRGRWQSHSITSCNDRTPVTADAEEAV